jgi:hypothetical protein
MRDTHFKKKRKKRNKTNRTKKTCSLKWMFDIVLNLFEISGKKTKQKNCCLFD